MRFFAATSTRFVGTAPGFAVAEDSPSRFVATNLQLINVAAFRSASSTRGRPRRSRASSVSFVACLTALNASRTALFGSTFGTYVDFALAFFVFARLADNSDRCCNPAEMAMAVAVRYALARSPSGNACGSHFASHRYKSKHLCALSSFASSVEPVGVRAGGREIMRTPTRP